jgi:hypothetical protein
MAIKLVGKNVKNLLKIGGSGKKWRNQLTVARFRAQVLSS